MVSRSFEEPNFKIESIKYDKAKHDYVVNVKIKK
jgi:hypothetical protein